MIDPAKVLLAFPHGIGDTGGMTLRQWYAGKALEGLLSDQGKVECTYELAIAFIIKNSWVIADAMLAHEQNEKNRPQQAYKEPTP